MADIIAGNFAGLFSVTNQWVADHSARRYEYIGTDDFVTFSTDFTDDLPATLIVPRLSQRDDGVSVNISNATIVFTSGSSTFANATDNVYSGDNNVTASWTIQDCNIVATNGAENGWGQSGTGGQGTTGNISNNNFVAIGNGTSWFVNHQGAIQVAFAGNRFTQGVFNSSAEVAFIGGAFDGTTRTHLGGAYTFRRNNTTAANVAWTMLHGNTFAGTDYLEVAGTEVDQASIYQTNINRNGVTEYSLNNRVESTVMSTQNARNNRDVDFVEGYTWNPSYIDAGTAADITDVYVSGLPATTRLPQATVDFTTDPALATNGLSSTTGYIFVTGAETLAATNADRVVVMPKARNLDGSIVTASTLRLKSFTHLLDTTTDTQINDIAETVSNTGDAWGYQNSHTFAAASDPSVGSYILSTVPSQVGDGSDLYPSAKKQWVEGTTIDENFGVTISGSTLITTKNIILGDDNVYTPTDITFNIPSVLTASPTIGDLSATSINVNGKGLNGITINGLTDGNFGALSNNANVTTTDTEDQTVVSIDSSTLISAGQVTVSGTSNNGTITTSGGSNHTILTGKATGGTYTSAAQVQVNGGSENATANAGGHLIIAGVNENLTGTSSNASEIRAAGSGTELNGCTLTGGRLELRDVVGGTYTSASATEVVSVDGGTFNSTGNFTATGVFNNATLNGSANATLIGATGSMVTALTTDLNGNASTTTFVGNLLAEGRTLTGVTVGAGTHDLRGATYSGGNLQGTVDLGAGTLTDNVTLVSNPTITITSTNITAWSSTGSAVIEATSALSVQITLDQADQFTAGPSGNVTFVAPVDYDVVQVTIPATANGRYSVRKNDAELIAPADIVNGTPIVLTFTTETGTDTATTFYGMLETDILRFARKYDSDLTDDGNRYIEERHNETFGTGDRTLTLIDLAPIGFLAEAAVAPTGITPTISAAGLISISSDAGTPISIISTSGMGLALEIGNLDNYFQVFHNANSDTATQQIQGGSAVGWDASRLTMQSGNVVEEDLPPSAGGANVTVNVPLQHAIAGWSPITGEPSTLMASRGGVLEIDGSVSGQASLGQVTQAVDASSVASTADINELKANQSNLKETLESNPLSLEISNLPFNTAD